MQRKARAVQYHFMFHSDGVMSRFGLGFKLGSEIGSGFWLGCGVRCKKGLGPGLKLG